MSADESLRDVSSAVRLRRTVIESPYASLDDETREIHTEYALRAMKDSFDRGEAPFASHLFYTSVLRDRVPEERALGMVAGFTWGAMADVHAFYLDLGVSVGMVEGFRRNVFRVAERARVGSYRADNQAQEIALRSLRTKLEIVIPHEKVYTNDPDRDPEEACEYFSHQADAFVDLIKRLS